jgi:soluble lytic murein transglycosylase-like protein
MSRARVAWLALLAALLVSDGGRDVPRRVESAGAVGARAALDAAEVAAHLGELNPSLSEQQIARIATAVVKYSAKYGLEPALVVAVIEKESAARPWARSPKGAIGLMQVMPYTMGSLGVAGNLAHIESNIEAGCMILADNIRRLGESRGILAYFWGNEVRGAAYLQRVEQARAAFRRKAES